MHARVGKPPQRIERISYETRGPHYVIGVFERFATDRAYRPTANQHRHRNGSFYCSLLHVLQRTRRRTTFPHFEQRAVLLALCSFVRGRITIASPYLFKFNLL